MSNVLASNSVYGPEASALFARMDVQPSDSRKMLISETIYQLQIAGIWDELDIVYFTAAHDAQAARLNWKSSSFNLTELGNMNFAVDQGYTRAVAAVNLNALDTGYAPSAGVKGTQNSNSIGVYLRTNANEGTADIGSLNASTVGYQINGRNAGNMQIRNNSSIATSVAVADSLGLISMVRVNSTLTNLYKRGVVLSSPTTAAVGTSTFNVYICAANVNGAIGAGSTKQNAFAYIGSGLVDQVVLYTIVQWYMTQIGANV